MGDVKPKTGHTDQKMSISARINKLIEKLNIPSIYALAKKTGVPRQTLDRAISDNKLSVDAAQILADKLKIYPEWIIFGREPMQVGDPVGGNNDSGFEQSAYAYIKKAKARLSAGGGVIPEEEFEDQRYAFIRSWLKTVATSESACVLMEIDGDSMRPTLESGDMVLVDQGRQDLISDGIYAFGEGDVINIKRLQRVYPNVRIVSDNPDTVRYPSREVDHSDIRIIGRVIWFGRQLR